MTSFHESLSLSFLWSLTFFLLHHHEIVLHRKIKEINAVQTIVFRCLTVFFVLTSWLQDIWDPGQVMLRYSVICGSDTHFGLQFLLIIMGLITKLSRHRHEFWMTRFKNQWSYREHRIACKCSLERGYAIMASYHSELNDKLETASGVVS